MLNTLRKIFPVLIMLFTLSGRAFAEYTPSPEVMKSREDFAKERLGIFIHWGIYSMFGQGEWYLNYGPTAHEYAKAAKGFYPINFNAKEWTEAIKDAGAGYICITSRHHDGFSMWHTAQSDYNIVDATPFKRDVIGELADACRQDSLNLHLYYSHLDWTRPDYPLGRTGHTTGRDTTLVDWPAYSRFMDNQLTELLTNYGPIRAIWFDGIWDHDQDSVPFNWDLDRQYKLIHKLQPACMVANNHHLDPFEGEDIQIFERDVPGENTAGYSEQGISKLPLETCQTMNGMWGYKVVDTNYKSTSKIVRLLARTAAKGANLLLNIGPQPDGSLPDSALVRLKELGEWMRQYGETIRNTHASGIPEQEWGVTTARGNTIFAHVLTPPDDGTIMIPADVKIKKAIDFVTRKPLKTKRNSAGTIIEIGKDIIAPDHIIEITI